MLHCTLLHGCTLRHLQFSHKKDLISQYLPVGQFLEQYPMLQRGQLLKQCDVGLVSGGDTGGSELLKQ